MSKSRAGWINEEFYKKLKIEAIKKNMNVSEYTAWLAKKEENIDEAFKNDEKKKRFEFRI